MGFGGPLKKYNVLKNLTKSQDCRPDSANTANLEGLEDRKDDVPEWWSQLLGLCVIWINCLERRESSLACKISEVLQLNDEDFPCNKTLAQLTFPDEAT